MKQLCVLVLTKNILKTELFENELHQDNRGILVLLKDKSNMTGDCGVFKFLRCIVNGLLTLYATDSFWWDLCFQFHFTK